MRRTYTLLAILLVLGCTARSAGLPSLNGSGAAPSTACSRQPSTRAKSRESLRR